jgi:hypothetical protein
MKAIFFWVGGGDQTSFSQQCFNTLTIFLLDLILNESYFLKQKVPKNIFYEQFLRQLFFGIF